MKIGLIGLRKSGKTTIFNALTRMEIATDQYSSAKDEPNIAVTRVADPRITSLSEMYRPKKTTYATLECIDFGGFCNKTGGEKKEVFSVSELGIIKNADALALVLRNFHDPYIDSLFGEPDPLSDIKGIISELIISDLILAETRIERVNHQIQRGTKNTSLELERDALLKIIAFLNEGDISGPPPFSPEEAKAMRGFRFLSIKPMLVILNSDEDTFGRNSELLSMVWEDYTCIEFAGRFEMELSQLDAHEAMAFMDDMDLSASAKDRLTMAAYELLGYISFFTVGPDEVRAWTIRKGDTALDAAAAIHSDLARGFIRAECFTYDDLVTHGSEKALKDKGLIRLEGKTYLMGDGDILSIRFNV
jgi:GTP-binding protein YchF